MSDVRGQTTRNVGNVKPSPSPTTIEIVLLTTNITNQPFNGRMLEIVVGSGRSSIPLDLGKEVRKRWKIGVSIVGIAGSFRAGRTEPPPFAASELSVSY